MIIIERWYLSVLKRRLVSQHLSKKELKKQIWLHVRETSKVKKSSNLTICPVRYVKKNPTHRNYSRLHVLKKKIRLDHQTIQIKSWHILFILDHNCNTNLWHKYMCTYQNISTGEMSSMSTITSLCHYHFLHRFRHCNLLFSWEKLDPSKFPPY